MVLDLGALVAETQDNLADAIDSIAERHRTQISDRLIDDLMRKGFSGAEIVRIITGAHFAEYYRNLKPSPWENLFKE